MSETSQNWIIDATDDSFERDVIQRSESVLCIVDFWAEWCAPCRMLGPVLEELANEFEGKFILVKVDTESAPVTSSNYGIQSIPAVFAFAGGEPVDGFNGVLPKEQIQEWIENQLQANEIESILELVKSDPKTAITQLVALDEKKPNEPFIQIALADAYLSLDEIEKAKELVQKLEDRGFLEPEAERVKAKLDLKSKEHLDVDQLKSQAESNPDDLKVQLEYAGALFGHEQYQEGFEICLQVIQRDKTGAGDKARELMVEVFRSLPDDSELTHEYRRKLSTALY